MIAGHFATALVPYELTRKSSPAPFWLFLLAAQFLDFLMLLFVSLGVEKLEPTNFLEAAFVTMHSEMFISHDIVPVLGWTALFSAAVWIFTGSRVITAWCAALVLLHEVFDLLVGFEHFVLGSDSPALGLNLYNRAPVTGLLVEAAICAVIVFWFCRHRAVRSEHVSITTQSGLYLLLVGSTLATLIMANQSLSSLLQL